MKKFNVLQNDSKEMNQKCCLCGNLFKQNDFGNNPIPLMKKDGERCCDQCNNDLVIESRILYNSLSKSEQKNCTNSKGWLKNVDGTIQLIKTIRSMRK